MWKLFLNSLPSKERGERKAEERCVLPKPRGHQEGPWGSALRCWHLPQGLGAAGCIVNQISQYCRQPRYQQPSAGQPRALLFNCASPLSSRGPSAERWCGLA